MHQYGNDFRSMAILEFSLSATEICEPCRIIQRMNNKPAKDSTSPDNFLITVLQRINSLNCVIVQLLEFELGGKTEEGCVLPACPS